MAIQTKKALPPDVEKWAREEGLAGRAIHPVTTLVSKPNEPVRYDCTVAAGDGPILFGQPYYRSGPHWIPEEEVKAPFVPLSEIGGVKVRYVGELKAEGVGIYVREGEYE